MKIKAKVCPHCSADNVPESLQCVRCQYAFPFRLLNVTAEPMYLRSDTSAGRHWSHWLIPTLFGTVGVALLFLIMPRLMRTRTYRDDFLDGIRRQQSAQKTIEIREAAANPQEIAETQEEFILHNGKPDHVLFLETDTYFIYNKDAETQIRVKFRGGRYVGKLQVNPQIQHHEPTIFPRNL